MTHIIITTLFALLALALTLAIHRRRVAVRQRQEARRQRRLRYNELAAEQSRVIYLRGYEPVVDTDPEAA